MFQEKAYSAAIAPLRAFLQKAEAEGSQPSHTGEVLEAEYMLACSAYEMRDKRSNEFLQNFLDNHPDTPHANRIYALMASNYFFAQDYDNALALFNASDLSLLADNERDDMTYRRAMCYLETGKVKEAAIWFETLKNTSPRYETDCTYYLSYIRYTQQRYDEALNGFLALQDNDKYQALVPYYIAEIYLVKKQYDKAEIVAQNYLSAYPGNENTAEMYRIIGSACYHMGKYHEAMQAFEQNGAATRRDARYMYGLASYHCGVYSQVPVLLSSVTQEKDALSQNAYLHMGLAYLKLAEKNKARMAFEQAAASDANRAIKEQAYYNYALCIHETSYSAFGESVTVFEKFLNDFPQSAYADKVSDYLVEVYMETRSYEAALKSINRIKSPNSAIQKAKVRILYRKPKCASCSNWVHKPLPTPTSRKQSIILDSPSNMRPSSASKAKENKAKQPTGVENPTTAWDNYNKRPTTLTAI